MEWSGTLWYKHWWVRVLRRMILGSIWLFNFGYLDVSAQYYDGEKILLKGWNRIITKILVPKEMRDDK